MSFAENLARVRERIAVAAERSGRSPSEITIVAVTKTFGPERVEEAVRAGIRDVGENRVQEFLAKADRVSLDCRWHLVGHLQTNKVNKAIGRFTLVQSVDSIKLAERLSRAGEERGITTDILVEVNTSGETSKHGFDPEETIDACGRIMRLPALSLRGLMTVGPWVEEEAIVARAFARLRELKESMERSAPDDLAPGHLSMGMSDDFELAIREGSTMVRLGRVLFGERA
jgi:pyridoxal phosphate enzyme (YggS family)